MNIRTHHAFIIILIGVLASLAVESTADSRRGKLLYENQCLNCHESVEHIESSSKVDSLRELRHQIIRWSINTNANWNKEDVNDVMDYLNEQHYKFQEKHI